ncbi:hypothetical protein [Cohnella sp. AR92]|uniref:hypothetical protein n=1 Tax=Cohnella sp. AR92 TaxID=648716 RepID=UPI0013152C76|nr:hypothetical protein [Cohnella sp. AR92]
MKNEPVYLLIWLIGLFVLIGIVLAVVRTLVTKDTIGYDKRITWQKRDWEEEREQNGN